jgi:hypothetical protein
MTPWPYRSGNSQAVMKSGSIGAVLRTRSFMAVWLFIIAVSVYDGFCVIAARSTIQSVERNPIGRWLIKANSGDIWLLLAAKTIGTVIAASLLLWLHSIRPHIGWIVCVSVAGIQLLLLCWLVGWPLQGAQ